MRYLIVVVGIIVGLHTTASATCYTPQQCTADTATLYLGGVRRVLRAGLMGPSGGGRI